MADGTLLSDRAIAKKVDALPPTFPCAEEGRRRGRSETRVYITWAGARWCWLSRCVLEHARFINLHNRATPGLLAMVSFRIAAQRRHSLARSWFVILVGAISN